MLNSATLDDAIATTTDARISTLAEVLIEPRAATAMLSVDANGYIDGMMINGKKSDLLVRADAFRVITVLGADHEPCALFQVIDGQVTTTNVAIDGV